MAAGSARRLTAVAAATVILSGCGPFHRTPATTAERTLRDITYCTNQHVDLKLDLYLPKRDAGARSPVVLYFHGGGWESGDKGITTEHGSLPRLLLDDGLAIAAVNYRLAPAYMWPDQIVDAKCAVRYIKDIADIYSLDAAKVGAIGFSAGGQIASIVGLAAKDAGFDLGQYLDKSSGIQAVVSVGGPSDLTAGGWPSDIDRVIKETFGSPPGHTSGLLAKASPVTYVTAGAPPFLIIHGDKDATVPVTQSQELVQKLTAAGNSATLVIIKNGGHIGGPNEPSPPPGAAPSPGWSQLAKQIADFLDKTLRS